MVPLDNQPEYYCIHTHTHTVHFTDRPTQLRVTDISSSQVTLTWDELSGALPQDHLYNVTCDGTAQGPPTTKNSYVISGLSQSTVYNCTVSETGIVNSLCSFEVLFMPGEN